MLALYPEVTPAISSSTWLRKWTKTWDEQDLENPFKPFPEWPYFDFLSGLFQKEEMLFVPKSRTVMATWWGVAECLHFVMTHGPATCIFWCPDEDRAVKCIKYCKVLYEQQDEELKKIYPPAKPLDQQAVFRFELEDGGWLQALPGKNPDKIRSEHPTIVMVDVVHHWQSTGPRANHETAAFPRYALLCRKWGVTENVAEFLGRFLLSLMDLATVN